MTAAATQNAVSPIFPLAPMPKPVTHTDVLLVVTSGEDPRHHVINQNTVTIGRSGKNDIVLNSAEISRRHIEVRRQQSSWTIVDSNSTNGVFMDGNRINPSQPFTWQPRQVLQIGPFYLSWQRHRIGDAPMTATPLPSEGTVVAGMEPHTDEAVGKLNIALKSNALSASPGDRMTLETELVNKGTAADEFRILVDDLPSEWVSITPSTVLLEPNQRTTVAIEINVPEGDLEAATYEFDVRAGSVTSPTVNAIASGRLAIQAFYGFEHAVKESLKRNGKLFFVTITNTGNVPDVYEISGVDDNEHVETVSRTRRLALTPSQRDTLFVFAQAKKRPLIGRAEQLPVSFTVRSHSGEMVTVDSRIVSQPRVTLSTMLWALLTIMLVAVVAWMALTFAGDLFSAESTPSLLALQTFFAQLGFAPPMI